MRHLQMQAKITRIISQTAVKKTENPKAGESGGRSMFFVYVFTAGALTLSAFYLMKIRRRRRLMADRQVVVHHDMRYSNNGGSNPHLNELYLDNDLI
mmetsp:Transcript_5709/g.5434  ORF Transcript_5709/g.5434 Transcript_5709/m.5434 type:complete len:97 (+) Transcript_5709:75-365(+)